MNIISSNSSAAQDIEREKLKVILIRDKTDISSETFKLIKNDILQVINKYVEIDISDIKIGLTENSIDVENYSIFIANLPKTKE